MMKITILHLYYDLMNLYGENGNVKAMKNYLEELGIKVNIVFSTISDELDLSNIDLIYIGSGTEQNQKIVLEHLTKYKKEINNYIDENKFIISTGNSFELFGQTIKFKDKKYNGLKIFDYNTLIEDFRIVDEIVAKSNFLNKPIIGFANHNGIIKDSTNPLFEIIKGSGNYPKSTIDGFNKNNFYGTYIIGPILARNPHLLTYLMNKLVKQKNDSFKIKKVNLSFENMAYDTYIKKYNL